MERWEYDVFVASSYTFEGSAIEAKKLLREMGNQGWELISVTPRFDGA